MGFRDLINGSLRFSAYHCLRIPKDFCRGLYTTFLPHGCCCGARATDHWCRVQGRGWFEGFAALRLEFRSVGFRGVVRVCRSVWRGSAAPGPTLVSAASGLAWCFRCIGDLGGHDYFAESLLVCTEFGTSPKAPNKIPNPEKPKTLKP